MIELIKTVVQTLNVDGSREQAYAIKSTTEKQAKDMGILSVLEATRSDIRTISNAFHWLKTLGCNLRQELKVGTTDNKMNDVKRNEKIEQNRVTASKSMYARMQKADEDAIRATGKIGSNIRVNSASPGNNWWKSSVDKYWNPQRRSALSNADSNKGQHPVARSYGWLSMYQRAPQFFRSAYGASRPVNELTQALDYAKQQLNQLTIARNNAQDPLVTPVDKA
jgi:hypothetical protein